MIDVLESATGVDLDGDHLIAGEYTDLVSVALAYANSCANSCLLRALWGEAAYARSCHANNGSGLSEFCQSDEEGVGVDLHEAAETLSESGSHERGEAGRQEEERGGCSAGAPVWAQLRQEVAARFVVASRPSALHAASFMLGMQMLRALPAAPLLKCLQDAEVHAVLRNVGDMSVELFLDDKWSLVGGWGVAKRYMMGIDEEASGSWAFVKSLAFGKAKEKEECPFWLWRAARWAALGVKGSGEEDGAAALPVALGVRVRFEKDSPGRVATDGHRGPSWCDVIRSSADFVLEVYLGANSWQWMKRGLFNVDEEEGTGIWRLVKNFETRAEADCYCGFGIPTREVGVYTLMQPDQFPLIIGRCPFWDFMQRALFGLRPSAGA